MSPPLAATESLPTRGGIRAKNRARVATLSRAFGGPFTADEAAEALDVDRAEAARIVGYLASRGWLARVRRGLYAPVPLEASAPEDWRSDPWLVAARVFDPCYIGGWSACEHWGLTEQLFREVLVVTARPQRRSEIEVQGIAFRVAVRKPEALFGTRPVWRGRERAQVSDPSRTIVDILDEPSIGGGIRHVADVLAEYFADEHRDDENLVAYGDRLGNRTVFKRLGYLLEELAIDAPDLVAACAERKSAGISALDPSVRAKGRITRRWNLRVNATVFPTRALA
jgi:predicted transcriptional regulator of viral defense system